jgi:hypothetical protein
MKNFNNPFEWETRHEMIASHAWKTWTNNGLNLDDDERWQTGRHAQDASNDAYIDGMSDQEWLDATLVSLKVTL